MKKIRHFLDLSDVSRSELARIMEIAAEIKRDYFAGIRRPILERKVLGMIFEKMSLRTRVSFEAGMTHLGGSAMLLEERHIGLGKRESIPDVSRVLSSMVDAIVFRAKKHETVEALARESFCPVVNALTDRSHPCQALADMMTIKEEFGSFDAARIAWVGDANNVAASLVTAAAMFGAEIVLSSPEGYRFAPEKLRELVGNDPAPGFKVEEIADPREAVRGARAIYTDVWVSMGQESEEAIRKQAFADWQVNKELMAHAAKDAIFLHCLPARRGLEVTDEVIDSPQSRVVAEAANRMHAQKGLLVWLLTEAN